MTGTFLAGTYRVDITPPLNIGLAGDFGEHFPQDVDEPLFANALYFQQGEDEFVIISLDVINITTSDFKLIREKINEQTGIPALHIIVSATHTHSGPVTDFDMDCYPNSYNGSYLENMKNLVISSAVLAKNRRHPAQIGLGREINAKYTHNRRLRRADGSLVMNWVSGLEHLTSDGSTDPEVLVMKVVDEQMKPIAFVVNYANHNNAHGAEAISADYSGIMGDMLRDIYGNDLVTVFLAGAAGDVNWINQHDPDRYKPDYYKMIGRSLAASVLQAESAMHLFTPTSLKMRSFSKAISERPWRERDITVDATFGEANLESGFFSFYQKAYEDTREQPLRQHEVIMNVFAIDDQFALCTNPAELFSDFGLEIKRRSAFAYTMVAELSNGFIGYVPSQKGFEDGGYETFKYPGNSFMAMDTGEQIVDAWDALLKEMRP